MFSLQGKTALITGAASGIGRAIAHEFAKQGSRVYIMDNDEKGGSGVEAEIKKEGGKAEFKKCNVAIQKEVEQVIQQIIGATGYIHILVNNAGIAHVGNLENTKESDFDRLMEVNVKGMYNCLHAVIPNMKKAGGCILNMASVAATVGIPDRFAYSTTKGAVVGMTLSVAKDYIGHKIRCNSISPGRVHTPFVDGFISKNYPGKEKEMFEKLSKTQPIGRMARPEEIAWLALYLCSDEAAFITGCDYPIDGGFIKLNN
ncbi:MAG: short-chain dehydrogenase [Bacteroidetes bacterium]|nr:MAG: short-chain dehydrogenase [Bacteroidota bacterium]